MDIESDVEMISEEKQPFFSSLNYSSFESEIECDEEQFENDDFCFQSPVQQTSDYENSSKNEFSCSPTSQLLMQNKNFSHHVVSGRETPKGCTKTNSELKEKMVLANKNCFKIPNCNQRIETSTPKPKLARKSFSLIDVSNMDSFPNLNTVLSWDTVASEVSIGKSKDSGYNHSNSMFSINSSKISKQDEDVMQMNEVLRRELEYKEVMINTLQESNTELRMKCAEAENKIVELRLKCERVCSCCRPPQNPSPKTIKPLSDFLLSPGISSFESSSSDSSVRKCPSFKERQIVETPQQFSKSKMKKKSKDCRQRITYRNTIVDCNLLKSQHRGQNFNGCKVCTSSNCQHKICVADDVDAQRPCAVPSESNDSTSKSEVCNTKSVSSVPINQLPKDMFVTNNPNTLVDETAKRTQDSRDKELLKSAISNFSAWNGSGIVREKLAYQFREKDPSIFLKSDLSSNLTWSDLSLANKKVDSGQKQILNNVLSEEAKRMTQSCVDVHQQSNQNNRKSLNVCNGMIFPGGCPTVGRYSSLLEKSFPMNYCSHLDSDTKPNKWDQSLKHISSVNMNEVKLGSSVSLAPNNLVPPDQSKRPGNDSSLSLRHWTELILNEKSEGIDLPTECHSNILKPELSATKKDPKVDQVSKWNSLQEKLSNLNIPSSNINLNQGTVSNQSALGASQLLSPESISTPNESSVSSLLSEAIGNRSSPKSTYSLIDCLSKVDKYAKQLSSGISALPRKLHFIHNIGKQ